MYRKTGSKSNKLKPFPAPIWQMSRIIVGLQKLINSYDKSENSSERLVSFAYHNKQLLKLQVYCRTTGGLVSHRDLTEFECLLLLLLFERSWKSFAKTILVGGWQLLLGKSFCIIFIVSNLSYRISSTSIGGEKPFQNPLCKITLFPHILIIIILSRKMGALKVLLYKTRLKILPVLTRGAASHIKCYNCAGFDDASQNCPSELFFYRLEGYFSHFLCHFMLLYDQKTTN
jgi:hypothetical protein